jgi:hypothetical protein
LFQLSSERVHLTAHPAGGAATVAGRHALTMQVTAGDAPLPESAQAMVAAAMRTIVGQPDGAAAEAQLL